MGPIISPSLVVEVVLLLGSNDRYLRGDPAVCFASHYIPSLPRHRDRCEVVHFFFSPSLPPPSSHVIYFVSTYIHKVDGLSTCQVAVR